MGDNAERQRDSVVAYADHRGFSMECGLLGTRTGAILRRWKHNYTGRCDLTRWHHLDDENDADKRIVGVRLLVA